jgi:hypothetical protein
MTTSQTRLVRAAVVALVAILAASCAGQPRASSPRPSQNHSCPSSGQAPPEGCWQMILPLGSGGFPAIRGAQHEPLWEPGRFPLTLAPHIAYDDALWMVSQTRAYSSPDGLTWTEHAKTDWGERIYESIIYFNGRMLMYGGLAYQARTFLNDIWSSVDRVTWSKIGNAAWSPRGSQTVVVYRNRLWLIGGANHIADDHSTDGFLNDVWVSDDGTSGHRSRTPHPGRRATRPASSSSRAGSTSSAARTWLTYGAVLMAAIGRHWLLRPIGEDATTLPGSRTTADSGCSAVGKTAPPMPSMMCGTPLTG